LKPFSDCFSKIVRGYFTN